MSKSHAGALFGAAVGGLAAVVLELSPLGIVASSSIGALGGSYLGSNKYASMYQYK